MPCFTNDSCKYKLIVVKFRTIKFTDWLDLEGAELGDISQTDVDVNAD